MRPFLDRHRAPPPGHRTLDGPDGYGPEPAEPPTDGEGGSAGVRPYYVTRGRVSSADRRVRVETIVLARPGAARRLPVHAREHHQLVALAIQPASVVELAVAMGVPVGVAIVLVGDLARDGVVDLSAPAVAPRDDVALIRRLIDGVCAL